MVEINKIYVKEPVPNGLDFEFDEKHPGKPHWLWIKNFKKHPRFLSVKTSTKSEFIYKAFGEFYYPIEDTPTQEVQKDLMAAVADHYDEIVGDLNSKIANFIFAQAQKLNLPKNVKILDLGAGTGISSLPFVRGGYSNLTLVDISEEMLSVAKNKPEFSHTNMVIQDLRNPNLSEKYDLVISGMVLCDFNDEELDEVLAGLIRFMNSGAHIIFVEDADRESYHQYFETIDSGFSKFNEYNKFYFVGKLHQ